MTDPERIDDESFDEPAGHSQPLNAPSGPLEVRPQCWMVGHRNPTSLLQCNSYVRTFERGNSPVHVCIDPGPQFDYPVIEANIGQLLGDIGELHSFSLNHQDPDVIGNAQFLCDANPNVGILVTEDTWRLAQHMLFRPGRVHFANELRSRMMIMGDHHRWQLVPTPFCHFRGAMAFYDEELRTLFTGDLFGGLNPLGRVHLFAEESDWLGIAQFHQIYMPSREVLRHAVQRIRALDPPVEVIAPQHGFVITGDLVPLFLDRMAELLVGFDLLALQSDERCSERFQEAILQLIDVATDQIGRDEVVSRLAPDRADDGLGGLFSYGQSGAKVLGYGYAAMVSVVHRQVANERGECVNRLRSEVLRACSERGLPIPPIGAGVEEGASPGSVGPDGIRTQAWWLDGR